MDILANSSRNDKSGSWAIPMMCMIWMWLCVAPPIVVGVLSIALAMVAYWFLYAEYVLYLLCAYVHFM
jgi:hypothetical protein